MNRQTTRLVEQLDVTIPKDWRTLQTELRELSLNRKLDYSQLLQSVDDILTLLEDGDAPDRQSTDQRQPSNSMGAMVNMTQLRQSVEVLRGTLQSLRDEGTQWEEETYNRHLNTLSAWVWDIERLYQELLTVQRLPSRDSGPINSRGGRQGGTGSTRRSTPQSRTGG